MIDPNTLPPDPHYAVHDASASSKHGPHQAENSWIYLTLVGLLPKSSISICRIKATDLSRVIVSIHGGAFMGCDKADMQVMPMLEGLKRGYAVVAVNYRLSGKRKFPALVQDVKAAVRWIRANARALFA